jgi:hypothetical protein
MLLRGRPDGGRSWLGVLYRLPPTRLAACVECAICAAQERRSPLATSQLWTLKGTVMGRFAAR